MLGRVALRSFQTSNVRHASRLVFDDYGVPSEVLKLESFETPKTAPSDDSVLVKMLMSPINPADVNILQGSYPVRPDNLPAVGGGEGVGVVQHVGERAGSDLAVGDWVIPCNNMSGCWTTHTTGPTSDYIKIRNDIPVEGAACLRINPSTAYRMLKDFVDLVPGEDVVIQNGANSACGQCAIQICKEMGVKTINVVRDRDDIDELKAHLTSLGADHVFTLTELRKSPLIRRRQIPAPRLALNCVGGDYSNEIARVLAPGGVHVTYGGMSREPVQAATSALIFKDVSFRGFWLSRWIPQFERSPQRVEMYDFLMKMMSDGKLQASSPPQLVKLKDYAEAMDMTLKGFKRGKFMFDMRDEI